MSAEPLLIQPLHETRTLAQEGRPVLSYTLSRPHLVGEGAPLRRMERYYARLARRWLERWNGPLYRRACAAEEASLAAARPFQPWSASFTWRITYAGSDALSLCWEVEEVLDGTPALCRQYDVWSLKDGFPLTLEQVLSCGRGWRSAVRKALAGQMEELEQTEPEQILPQWRSHLRRALCTSRFYLTPEGPVLLVPPGLLRPVRVGWAAFPLQNETAPGLPDTDRA